MISRTIWSSELKKLSFISVVISLHLSTVQCSSKILDEKDSPLSYITIGRQERLIRNNVSHHQISPYHKKLYHPVSEKRPGDTRENSFQQTTEFPFHNFMTVKRDQIIPFKNGVESSKNYFTYFRRLSRMRPLRRNAFTGEKSLLHHPVMKRNANISFLNSLGDGSGGTKMKRLPTGGDEIYGRIYRHGPPARLTRDNISVRESDIAAIFRGVAYGPPTESAVIHSALEHIDKQTAQMPQASSTRSSAITYPKGTADSDTSSKAEVTRKSEEKMHNKFTHNRSLIEESMETTIDMDISEISTNAPIQQEFSFPTTIKLLVAPKINFSYDDLSNKYFMEPIQLHTTTDSNLPDSITESENMISYTTDIYDESLPEATLENKLLNSTDILVDYNNSLPEKMNGVFPIYIFTSYTWKDYMNFINKNIEKIWKIHLYSMGCIFGIISLVSFHRLCCRCKSFPFFLHFSFYIVMFASSLVRALIFFWDPYREHQFLPELVQKVLYIAAEPCVGVIMSSFIVLLLNVLYGMIVLPVIIAFFSAAEMGTSLFGELALKYLASHVGHLSQNFLATVSFTTGMLWNGILCLSYIVLLNSKRFRQSRRKHRRKELTSEDGNVKSNSDSIASYSSRNIIGYCYIATFAQLFMISLYVYILLHPHELLMRPTKLKEKWIFFQIVARLLEFIVYTFLLLSASKLSEGLRADSIRSNASKKLCSFHCCCCCSECGEDYNNIENARVRRIKYPVDVYTLSPNSRDDDNSVAVKDFQLVWKRSNTRSEQTKCCETLQEVRQGDADKCKSGKVQNTKVKKLKSLKERNELYNSIQEAKRQQNECCSTIETSQVKPSNTSIQNESVIVEHADIHTNSSTSKYESIRGKYDISKILDAKLPPVDESMYKYMGVTAPTSNKGDKNIQSWSNKTNKTTIEEGGPSEPRGVKDSNDVHPKSFKQFWSPQHKSSKLPSMLPPLPLKVQSPLNLTVFSPKNIIPMPPADLPDFIRPFPGRRTTTGSQQDLSRNKTFHAGNCLYTPSREFIRDFMSSRPSPFSERFSSADLATISSYSEMRVDYLTDLSSADGQSLRSISRYSRASRMSMSNISDQLNYY